MEKRNCQYLFEKKIKKYPNGVDQSPLGRTSLYIRPNRREAVQRPIGTVNILGGTIATCSAAMVALTLDQIASLSFLSFRHCNYNIGVGFCQVDFLDV